MDKSPSFLGPLGEPKKALLEGVDSSRLRGFHIWSRSKRVPPILSSFLGRVACRRRASELCALRMRSRTYNSAAIIIHKDHTVMCAVKQKREQEGVRGRRHKV